MTAVAGSGGAGVGDVVGRVDRGAGRGAPADGVVDRGAPVDGVVGIVGVGHAGLVVANALARRSIGFVAYDRAARVGDEWRHRHDALRLNTEAACCEIPGHPLPSPMDPWPTATVWAEYLCSVAETLAIVPVRATVCSIDRVATGWRVQTDTGEATHPFVVVATGRARTPRLPQWSGASSSDIAILHSSRFDRGERFAGRRVLVVGSGNSGTEIAHELVGHAQSVALSVRTRPIFVRRVMAGVSSTRAARIVRHLPDRALDASAPMVQRLMFGDLRRIGLAPPDLRLSELATNQGPTFDAGFIESVRSARITIVADIDRLGPDRVHLTDGSTLEIDVVIAATGYGTGLDRFVPGKHLDDSGWPYAAQRPF